MNHGIYRLVFNQERNSWVAVAENVRGRGKKSNRRRMAAVVLGLLAGAGGEMALAAPPAATALPVPSTAVAKPFVFAGTVTGGQPTTVGNTMTINAASRTVGLNWQSFDIGSSAKVEFVQPDASSKVLNRIWDNNPTQIMGQLKANGQVYLINQNGILFGAGSQVNVGGLVASSLNLSESMTNKLLNYGLPTAKGDSLEFVWDGDVAGFNKGAVIVEAGAEIRSRFGGRVVLIAPKTVENRGIIARDEADGAAFEAILAAGGKVILTAPDDPSLRGLLVETQAVAAKDTLGNNVALDGVATNSGQINAGTGGIASLAALAVNQKGIVNATKAVNINGTTMLVSGTTETDRLTINQRGSIAEIDWVSGFNVGAGKMVEFVQASSGAVAYNIVNDGDINGIDKEKGTGWVAFDGSLMNQAGRTSIDGLLKANGQFVLINEKGIDFGADAKVSASNIVASALGINKAILSSGLLGQSNVATRAFYLNLKPVTYSEIDPALPSVLDNALGAVRQATVNVSRGAQIESGSNGYVILAGMKVDQAGSIFSNGGQALLAAGADLYLKPGYSAASRGFTAEVNPFYMVRTEKDSGTLDDDGNKVGITDSNKTWVAFSRGADANSVTNTGTVSVRFGDISLVGHEIIQAGSLLSSTSATSNGSIHLVARDQLNTQGEGEPTVPAPFFRQYGDQGVLASKPPASVSETEGDVTKFVTGMLGGKLTFATGSKTVVDIDGSNGKTLTADQVFVKSSIEAMAKQIVVADAVVEAHGGDIRMRASEQFNEFSAFAIDAATPDKSASPLAGVGIFIGDGARIDASGTTASKSVADLFIEVELRGDEFADNPVQRNGKLRGEKAWVDIRDKVSIANVDGWVKKVGQTVFEKSASGGEISLGSTGSVIVKSGSVLDVSGGKIDYATGSVKESVAITQGGKRYRLNDAPTSAIYSGLVTTQRTESAYVEGKSAGTVALTGQSLAVDGNLLAKTTIGTKQRELGDPVSNRYAIPYGGRLIVKDAGQHYALANRDKASEAEKIAAYTQAQIAFVSGAAKSAAELTENSVAGARLELSKSLADAGFSRFDITSDGRIDIPADVSLNLAAGGIFSASGRQIYVAGDIVVPSGSIALKTNDMSTKTLDAPGLHDAKFSTLTLDADASLSTAGLWINDYLDGRLSKTAKATNGGSITLTSAYDLDLREGSVVDVSGGGWVNYKGSVTSGNAGSIALATGGVEDGGYDFVGDGDRRDASIFLDGSLSGYALGKGGKLTIKTSAISFGEKFAEDSRNWSRDQRVAAGQVGAAFDSGFVDRGGFYGFSFVGRDGVTVANRLTIDDGVRLAPDPINWSLARVAGYRYRPTGSGLADFAQSVVLHSDLRTAPTSLSLATRSLEYGDLLIGENAYLGVSPQGSVDLVSMAQLTVLGTIEAPAGKISLSRPASKDDDEKILVGSQQKGVSYNTARILFSEGKQSESIYLGPNSRLLASGSTVLSEATRLALDSGVSVDSLLSQSRYKGTVLDGGSVSLDAGLGYLITRGGSLIDVSGTSATLNVATSNGSGITYPALVVGSAGGKVSLAARDGMFVDGAFDAQGKNHALNGLFSLRFGDIGNLVNAWDIKTEEGSELTEEQLAMMADRQLTLYQSADDHADTWPSTVDSKKYLAGSASFDPVKFNGKASLDLASLVAGKFGLWSLSSQNEMRFSGSVDATVNNQIKLNAPKFSAADEATRLELTAAAVQIGNLNADGTAYAASIGNATANISALDLSFIGTFGWNGFASTKFVSQGEIHFDSVGSSGSDYKGQMSGSGALILSAARLSPATYSNFRVDLLADPNGSISITRPEGAVADVSLSVGGRLEFAAKSIEQDGTVSAPLGEIVFSAPGGKVTLGSGSITSVAADRNLLFGYTTESGTAWKYLGSEIKSSPSKSIRIDATDTVVSGGAKLDLSGGGDALAWEYTEGPGGKTDVLSASTTTFAILPGWNGFTATDGELQQGYLNSSSDLTAALRAGDRISLATNPSGLTGSYVLLPARYAVLQGAYLITVKTNTESVLRGARVQADGSWLVSGSRLAVNADGTTTSYSSAPLTLELASSSVTAKRASYTTTKASQFFYDVAGAELPGDAGRLTAIGRESLAFDPAIIAMRSAEISAADGRKRAASGLQLDLAAPKLLVSDGGAASDETWSVLDQNKLNALGVSSLLLGGARVVDGSKTTIESIASDVVVSNSNSALTAAELMLAATENLTAAEGSRIESKGSAGARDIVLNGDGAFLRLAEGEQASLTRSEGSVNRTQGDLTIAAGASVAGKSQIFDATRSNTLDGTVLLGSLNDKGSRNNDGAISIGAGRLNIVGDDNKPTDGLTLDNAYLARFSNSDQLRLASYSTLDLYGNALLGSATLKELVIAAAGIAGHGDSKSVATIAAKTVSFTNPKSASEFTSSAELGKGRLSVKATTIEFGESATTAKRETETAGFSIRGFDNVDLSSTGDVRFAGTGVTAIDNIGGSGKAANLNISAARVVTVDTANHLLVASGATTVSHNPKASGATSDTGLGGSLELRGKSLDVSGKIDVAAGNVTLDGSDYLTILKDAFVGAEGRKVVFDDTSAYASSGTVTLKSAQGNVTVESGAVVSVSADAGGGDAGSLSLLAPKGKIQVAANALRASAASDAGQGALKVDGLDVSLDSLADAVVDANGARHFIGRWDVRRRADDLVLNKEIQAQAIKLAADAGNIDIAGTIDASGSRGGKIELYANRANGVGGWVNLLAGSKLKANAKESVGTGQGTNGQGGTVIVGVSASEAVDELATGINFEAARGDKSAALIDVSTALGSSADKGKVIFRAPRQDTLANLVGVNGAVIVSNDTIANVMATSYLFSLPPAITSLGWGTTVGIRLSANSLGPAVLSLGNLGNKDVLRADGSMLADSDLVSAATGKVLVFDGNAFRISPTAVSAIPATPANAALTGGAYQVAGTVPAEWGLVSFKAGANSAASPNLKIGTKTIKLLSSNGSALAAGAIKKDQLVLAVFDGTNFRLSPTTPAVARAVTLARMPDNSEYRVDSTKTVAPLVKNSVVTFTAHSIATAGATLKVGSNDAKLLLNADGSPLTSDVFDENGTRTASATFAAGQSVVAVYDGTAFRISTVALKDAGTVVNTYKVTPAQIPANAADFKMNGYTLTFRAKATNTGAAKLTVITADSTSGSTVDLKWADGTPLASGAIKTDQLLTVVYTINSSGVGEFRIVSGTELAVAPVTDSAMAKVTLNGNISGAGNVVLEAVKTTRHTGDVVLGAEQQAFLLAGTAQASILKGQSFLKDADSKGRLGVVFRPGEEIRSTGDISIGANWDLSEARYNMQPGALSLRAEGNVNISGSLSDGFVQNELFIASSRDATLASRGDSWSYRVVAGADPTQASPMATKADAAVGSIAVGANKLVRTGTGTIDMAAGQDIKLFDRAAVYTAGVDASTQPEGFVSASAPVKSTVGEQSSFSMFPSAGGDISLAAGERILMVKTGELAPDERHINEWLFRAGGKSANLQWWSRIASFQQGVAAFGGGDIDISAGQEIRNLVVAIPTNGRVPSFNGESLPDKAVVQGGGDLSVRTSGKVTGGLFYAETGALRIDAGALKSDVGIALGNTDVKVRANGDIELGNVFNPLWVDTDYVYNTYSGTSSLGNSKGTATWAGANKLGAENDIRFGTYGENSLLNVVSVGGDVALNAKDTFFGKTDSETHRLMPSRVKVAALNGDIAGSVTQAPGENGQLDILAQGAITLKDSLITQLDVPVEALPSVRNPLKNLGTNGRSSFQLLGLLKTGSILEQHSATGWHASDTEPSRLIALKGDITAETSDYSVYSSFNEAVRLKAAGDIVDVNLSVQHNHANDVSSVVAGGYVKYSTSNSSDVLNGKDISNAYLGMNVVGEGGLEVIAGKGVDLADTWGIVSSGNLKNPYLPENGASILVSAGATPDYDSLRAFLKVGKEVSDADLRQRFFTGLRDFGKEAQATGDERIYEKGRLLANAFFPTEKIGKGDVKLSVSQIKTEQGGGIYIFAPGGSVQAGVADPTLDKKASEQGIFTIRDGDIFAYVANNFLVNQSRVFTLDGGDIMIWADHGNIDAGSGSKTLISTPPPVLVIRNGQIVLDTSNSISGSGIGVLASRDDTRASDMSLFAPEGAIDAGDAGLRSTGNITLGARVVLNANNIQAAGSVAGAPAPVAAAAPVAMVTTPTNNENKALEDAAPAAGNKGGAGGMLTVEVLDSEPASSALQPAAAPAKAPASNKDDERKRKSGSAG